MADWTARATHEGADVVLFPELAITGYPPEDLVLRPEFVEDNLAALQRLAKETAAGCDVIVGFVDRTEAGLHNAAALLRDGSIAARYAKCKLPNYGVFDEKRYFVPGTSSTRVTIGGSDVGLSVCEDAWLPGPPFDSYGGVTFVANINGSPFDVGKAHERTHVLRDRAQETGAWIVYVNAVGGQDELVFDGGTIAIDEVFEAYRRALGESFSGTAEGVAEENLQARIRGNLLMALSNKFGSMVLATGNKSEYAVGYATLYGDMSGGFAPIKDVPKTLVYELCAWRNARAAERGETPPIPQSVIDKPPSAELR